MRVITFGSCLARITGLYATKLFGGSVVSSVYHNRADAFVGRFVDGTWKEHSIEETTALLVRLTPQSSAEETSRALMLREQCRPWVGLHKLPDGLPVFEALKTSPDLIVVDNDIDLRVTVPTPVSSAPTAKAATPASKNPLQQQRQKITVAQAVESMTRLLDHFHQEAPNAVLVFMNFPHTTYKGNPVRVACTKEFEKRFTYKKGLVIPCLDVVVARDNQHFKTEQYMEYVGLIADHFRRIGKGDRVIPLKKIKPTAVPQSDKEVALAKIKKSVGRLYRAKDYSGVVKLAAAGSDYWDAGSLYCLGISYDRTGNKPAAFAAFARLSELTPVVQQGLERAIMLAQELGKIEPHAALWQKHAKLFPTRGAFRAKYPLEKPLKPRQ